MPAKRRSSFQQAGVQVDRALWCLQDHPGTSVLLALPTLIFLLAIFIPALLLLRHWQFPPIKMYLIYVVTLPTLACMILTLCPLPAAIFAHALAQGRKPDAAECFRQCLERSHELARLAAGLLGRFLSWNAFFTLPALVFWPRSCLAAHVVLFEQQDRIFRRSGKLLREEAREISLLLYLYLGIAIVLGQMLFMPRLLMSIKLLDLGSLQSLRDYLAPFELFGACSLLVVLSICWTLSLTFLYMEIRTTREGMELVQGLQRASSKYGAAASNRLKVP